MNCNSNTMPLIETEVQTACNNGCVPKDINVICRKIVIPTGQNILGVQGDLSSISRTFVVPKTTEDGYDLSDKVFHMVIENSENEQWEELISAENIEILENYIKLKWNLLPKDTQYSGALKVSIKASKDNFTWQTYIASFEIQPSLVQPEDIKIPLNLQDKTVEPNNKVQVVTYDDGYDGLNSVTVDGSADLLPENIVTGKEIFNVEGTFSADGNATSADLLEGKIAYSQGEKIEGTLALGDIDDASYFFFHGARWDERDKLFPLLQNIIDASYMFQYSPAKELDVTALNTSKVKNMSNMFANVSQCTNFNLGDFDTSDVINMYSMFYFCSQVNKLDVSSFDTTKVTNMSYMFSSCPKLTEIKFGDKFNTSNVTNMERLFYQGSLIDNIPALYADKCENIRTVMSYCSVLKNFGGFVNLGKAYSQKTANAGIYGLTLSDSNLLTHDSLMNVINGLYDLNLSYNVSGGGILYPQALKLGSTNLAKLTEEEIAIATNKGWNVT